MLSLRVWKTWRRRCRGEELRGPGRTHSKGAIYGVPLGELFVGFKVNEFSLNFRDWKDTAVSPREKAVGLDAWVISPVAPGTLLLLPNTLFSPSP